MAQENPSPFAALTYSEQQEQWRIFRARHLEYLPVEAPVEQAVRQAPQPVRADPPPHHGNLDRVRAQLAAASRRAGAYQPVPVREREVSYSPPRT